MSEQVKERLNKRYAKAVCAAAAEIDELAANAMTYELHVRKIITDHLTPLFRELRDEAKRNER